MQCSEPNGRFLSESCSEESVSRWGVVNSLNNMRGPLPESCSFCIPVPLANEVGDSGIGPGQRLFIRQEHDAEMLGAGLLAEAGAVDDHDVLLAD